MTQDIPHRLERLFGLADQIESRVALPQQQVDTLTPLPATLFPQDPNDEPAFALIELIRLCGRIHSKT